MRKVLLYSLLLIAGRLGSQVLPLVIPTAWKQVETAVRLATMVCLSFIMIHVGYEFDLDRKNIRSYDGTTSWPSSWPSSPA